ncbi:hypothetical protein ABAC460_11175 [Asticcacaulis sp. AC460]|uniref:hypothetical protein n=1 Tax=Asticcacaulis sp. AC460 TaxID=1282360 RepID=UPI0003C3C07B|nr:hypothetical protein [Asticcacaulis sp. AC460]ESQ89856.1 hypothetical protein ABAC460_11175 [Asticcacaulis sp. AC460]
MKVLTVWMSVLVFACLPASAMAQTLWQNVSEGMSKAQVSAAQPSALPASDGELLSYGASCDLAISSQTVAGRPYRVCFYFTNGELVQVSLVSEFLAGKEDVNTVAELLQTKYGAAIKTDATDRLCDAEWKAGEDTVVTLLYVNAAGTNLLGIHYQSVKQVALSKSL